MAREILTKHVPAGQVVLLVIYALPAIIAMAAPFACMVGTLMTIGRLSSDNEILVMLSSGLSYGSIFLPAFVVGLLISVLSFFANDVLLPAGTVQFNRLYLRILISTPALELEANSVKRFKDTVIVTGNVAGSRVENVLIFDRTRDGERRLILAADAELRDGGREGLSLEMDRAFVQSSGEVSRRDYDYASSESLRYWVPQEDLVEAVPSVGPREMSSIDVRREIRRQENAVRERLNERGGRLSAAVLALEESLRGGPEGPAWNRRENLAETFAREYQSFLAVKDDRGLLMYRLEYYKKFSIPFGAFSFVFLSVSLGFLAKRSGQTVGFVIGLIIAVIYWALLFGGQTMGMRLGYSPFWSMWLPNILALAAGLVMCLFRIRR
jgi:lipopolysaccharide export system permease protein